MSALQTVLEHMHAGGLEPRGAVGVEDPLTAISDALVNFDADLIILRLHAPGSEHENWREHEMARRVRSLYQLPTIVFYFDGRGRVLGRDEA